MVQGHLQELWAGVQGNANDSRGCQLDWLRAHWNKPQGLVKYAYPLLSAAAVISWALVRRGPRLIDVIFAGSVLLGLYVQTTSVSGQRILAVIIVAGLAWYLEESPLPAFWKTGLILAATFVVIGAELRHLVQGVTTLKPADTAALRAKVDELHPPLLIVDDWALRYVFNYRLRPGMIYIGVKTRPESDAPFHQQKFPDECWVISAETVLHYTLHVRGMPIPRFMKLGGHRIGEWITNAGEMAVLPPTTK
jgi:hypothetical protein